MPDLLLAIKASVDEDTRPGRFLLTGSANLMALPLVADNLAGRLEVIKLLPLAQSGMFARSGGLLDKAFACGPLPVTEKIVGPEILATVLAGGYPEALTHKRRSWRQDWHLD